MLLDESNGRVNPESKDKDGPTQLAQESRDGNLGAAKFLLGLDVANPDSKDSDGRTSFLHAAANSCLDVLKLLVGTSKVDDNVKNSKGTTAVLYAAQKWGAYPYNIVAETRDQVLKFWLKTCDPSLFDLPDKEGRTPLSYATGASRIAATTMRFPLYKSIQAAGTPRRENPFRTQRKR